MGTTYRHRGHVVLVGEKGRLKAVGPNAWARALAPLPAEHVEAANIAIDHLHSRGRVQVTVHRPLTSRILPESLRRRLWRRGEAA